MIIKYRQNELNTGVVESVSGIAGFIFCVYSRHECDDDSFKRYFLLFPVN